MNSIDLNVLRNFQSPEPKSFWSFKSFAYLLSNISTFGIVDAVDATLNLSRIKEIKLKQQNLIKQASDLNQKCGKLEERLGDLENEFEHLNQANQWRKPDLDRRLTRLSSDRDQLAKTSIKARIQNNDPDLTEVVLTIIVYVGHLLANIFTVGLYGAYQRCVLKSRIKELKAQNQHIKAHLRQEIDRWQNNKVTRVKTRIDRLQNPLAQNVGGNPAPVNPKDQARLYKEIADLKKQITNLKAEQTETERAYNTLKANHTAMKLQHTNELQQAARANNFGGNNQYYINKIAEKDREFEQEKENLENRYKAQVKQQKKQIEELQEKCNNLAAGGSSGDDGNLDFFMQELEDATRLNAVLNKQLEELTETKTKLQKVKNDRDVHLREKQAKDLELNQVRRQLNDANARVAALQTNVGNLETEVNRLQPAGEYLPFKDRLGPIPPKYVVQHREDGENELKNIRGEIGVADQVDEDDWSDYAKRYNNLKTAPEVFIAGFRHALSTIYEMAAGENAKIKLNKSASTQNTDAAEVLYRFTALDFIKGGFPIADCHAYEQHVLQLNNEKVVMYSSAPEKVLECEVVNGVRTLKVVTHLQYGDDFTPSIEVLNSTTASNGIDPIGAKCIWNKLTDVEKQHLFNLLMEPAIEDTNPDLQASAVYLQRLPQERAQLIYSLRDLIIDMGTAFQKKFAHLTKDEWKATDDKGDYKYYIDPLVVEEIEEGDDEETKIAKKAAQEAAKIQPFVKNKKEFEAVEEAEVVWQLNEDVLKTAQDGFGRPIFFNLMESAKKDYQVYFSNAKKEFHEKVYAADYKPEVVTKEDIENQYHISHKVLNPGCLFSGLLAIFMKDVHNITENNISYLKKSMAAYLDQLKKALDEVARIKSLNLPPPANYAQLQASAKLYEKFEDAIRVDHKMKVVKPGRFNWENKEEFVPMTIEAYQKWLRGEVGAPVILSSYLTPTQIDIVAHLLGVRIAVISVPYGTKANSKGRVDEQGRLMPVNENIRDAGVEISANYFGPNTKEVFLMASKNNYTYFGLFPKLRSKQDLINAGLDVQSANVLNNLDNYWHFPANELQHTWYD